MGTLLTRTAQDLARERIEQAFRDYERCSGCGADMKITERGGSLHIECASLAPKSGIRYSLAIGLHDSRVVDLPEGLAAAA